MSILKPFRFIDKQTIESKATKILESMAKTPQHAPEWPLDASRVAEFLGLDIVWDRIPDDEQGAIAARILPLEHLIEINENIPKLRGGFGESTIAHEIGHWVLHIDSPVLEQFLSLQRQGKPMNVEPLMCRSDNLRGVEWQAQYFASCLLMPKAVLIEKRRGRDLTRWRHLYEMTDELGVTISNLVHRLKDLGWIRLERTSRQIQLGQAVHRH